MNKPNQPHAIIIGAGIGGLTAALDLAARGLKVTVFERAQQPGGKMREVDIQGRRIDSGPTVFTMRWVFDELFADAGSSIDEHLQLRPCERLARHAWPDGTRLDLFADLDRSTAAIAAFSGKDEARRYRAFCTHSRQVFQTLYAPFMRSQRPSPFSLMRASGLRGLMDLWRIRPFESLWRSLGHRFRDPRLRGLFARYATYCGSSPLQAPATLMLIAHVEQRGVWQVEGGMQRLAEAIATLFQNQGGRIHYDSAVSEIDLQRGRTVGVVLESGERVAADAVVVNADVAGMARGLLGRSAASAVPGAGKNSRSLSAVTWSILAKTSGFELDHHNVFFPADYPQEFSDIFRHQRLPAQPAVYICAQDRHDAGAEPQHSPDEPKTDSAGSLERLFMITNAPATGDRERFDRERIEPTRSAAFRLLEECGLRVETDPEHSVVTTPADFEARFPGSGGALYGAPVHGWRSSFTRPGARTRVQGLYQAGGGVHPGAGVPMVAMSGRLAAEAAAADLGLDQPR